MKTKKDLGWQTFKGLSSSSRSNIRGGSSRSSSRGSSISSISSSKEYQT